MTRLHTATRSWLIPLLLATIALTSANGAPATATAQEERATVRLNGRAVFRVGAAAGADATTRARQIERRLNALLQNPQAIAPARVEPSGPEGRERVLSVAGVPAVTITEDDARDNLTTVDALATQWAGRIDSALVSAAAQRQSAWSRLPRRCAPR